MSKTLAENQQRLKAEFTGAFSTVTVHDNALNFLIEQAMALEQVLQSHVQSCQQSNLPFNVSAINTDRSQAF